VGLSIQFTGAADGGDGPFPLASANGWALFAEWAAALPAAASRAVRALADAGEVTGTDALAAELAAALAAHPPENPAVADTARGLAELVGGGDPGETATVTGEDGEP
jgi:hypothetical protein